jgi:hypothetical protein
MVAVNNRTKGIRDRKARAEGRSPKAKDIIDLDESDSEKRISKKRSREAKKGEKEEEGLQRNRK